jgi:predicted amidophosphoribosyltransferase
MMWILAQTCLVCSKNSFKKSLLRNICFSCYAQIPFIRPEQIGCTTCGKTLPCGEEMHPDDASRPYVCNRSAVAYTAAMKAWLHAYKFNGEVRLAKGMGEMMIGIFEQLKKTHHLKNPMFTFVPIHQEREQERGFNQAELLAQVVARRTGYPCVPLLKRIDKPDASLGSGRQSMRSMKERFKQQNEFSWKEQTEEEMLLFKQRVRNCDSIILIDDIFTTGRTVLACAEVVKKRIETPIFCLTWARTI